MSVGKIWMLDGLVYTYWLSHKVFSNSTFLSWQNFVSFWGPGKTTYTFSVTFRFLLRLFSVLPAGGGGWVRLGGGGGSGGGNRKYIGISGKRIR
jgi:hypothetical protein